MTVRTAICAGLAADPKTVEEIQGLYWPLEKSATSMALLLWFPRPLCLLPMPSMFCWVPTSEIIEVSQLQYKSSTEEITTLLAFAGVINVLFISNH